MKVYVVTYKDIIAEIFSTWKRADIYLKTLTKKIRKDSFIDEYEVIE